MKSRNIRRPLRQLRRGFSLIEVIVAVTIIAIFAGLVAPQLLKRLSGAKQDQARTEANAIAAQVKIYLTNRQESKLAADFQLDNLVPEYLESTDDLLDPWGNRYLILEGTNGRDFDIVSYGADGTPGGEGENADITHGKAPKKSS
ncbi:MAG: type II secretion system protein GspG [Phycisphaerales bacterium]|jgi:general secretion pathway protein G